MASPSFVPRRRFLLALGLVALCKGNRDVNATRVAAQQQAEKSSVALANQPAASSADVRLELAYAVHDQFLKGTAVCEGTSIRQLLRLDATDFQTISHIDFEAIQKQADGYIVSQQKKVSDLEAELQKYAQVLPALKQDEVTEDVISKLLKDAMTKGFGSVPETAQSQCGLMRDDNAYDDTAAAWKAAVSETLRGRKAEMEMVKRLCVDSLESCAVKKSLSPTAFEGDSFCPRLCEELAGMASSLAMSEPDVQVGDDKLTLGKALTNIERAQKDLEGAQAGLRACETARPHLVQLGEEIRSIKSEVDEQAARQRKASQDLYKLMGKLEKDSAELDEQQKRTQSVLKLLRDAKGHEHDLTLAVEQHARDEAKLAEETKRAREQLVRLMASVRASGDAVRAVQEFKGDLSITMKSMLQIFEDVVQTPLKDLTDDLDRLDFAKWPKAESVASTQSALRNAAALHAKCEVAAKMTAKVDRFEVQDGGSALTSMCRSLQNDWKDTTSEIARIVNEKREEAINAVKLLKTDLHALGCSQDSKYRSQVKQGEPEHLRGVVRLFKDSHFYRDYASSWLMGTSTNDEPETGNLLKLFKTLEEVYARGEMDSKLEREQFNLLEQQHKTVVEEKERLGKQLTEAFQEERADGLKVREAQEVLDKWQADVQNLEAMRDTFKPQALRAEEAQKRARQGVVRLHAALTGSFQSSLIALGEGGFDDDSTDAATSPGPLDRESILKSRVLLHRSA